jgi:hypothetical protein
MKWILWIFTLQFGWFPGPEFPDVMVCNNVSYNWAYVTKPYGENSDYLCLPEGMDFLLDDPGLWPFEKFDNLDQARAAVKERDKILREHRSNRR